MTVAVSVTGVSAPSSVGAKDGQVRAPEGWGMNGVGPSSSSPSDGMTWRFTGPPACPSSSRLLEKTMRSPSGLHVGWRSSTPSAGTVR